MWCLIGQPGLVGIDVLLETYQAHGRTIPKRRIQLPKEEKRSVSLIVMVA